MNHPKNLTTNFLLLIPGTVWGISFIAVELILPAIPPISLTLGRSLISIVMLLGMLWYVGGTLPSRLSDWSPFFLLAAVNLAIPFALTAWGQIYIDGGLASILLSVMPLFTALLAYCFTPDEKLTIQKMLGIGLGLIGIVVLIGPGALGGVRANVLAQLAIVGAALCYAIGAVYLRFVYPLQPEGLSTWALRMRMTSAQFVASAILLLPFSLWWEAPWTIQPSLEIWGYMLFLGIGVTLLATVTYFYLIEELGAGTASTTIYLIPVAGMILGNIVLGEAITAQMIFALGLILLGIFIVNRTLTE
ncbi:DMT family transporter [Chloroflexi bacterium TSY]|nr:DMT family transporter [Chloroflexi bacterium TSY]